MKLWASTDLYGDNQIQVCLTQPDGRFGYGLTEIEVDEDVKLGDWVYMIIATYTTGSTFGTETGNKAFAALLTDADKAFSLAAAFKEHNDRVSRYSYRPSIGEDKYHMEWEGKTYYVGTWTGYFERLEDCEVIRVAVGA